MMRADQERVRNLLTDTVTLLCKNGLQYQTELRVQGVLGITLDNNDVFIVHINEKFGGDIGGAISIRNDEGDAAKTLLGSRKSHDLNRSDAPGSINSKTEHKRRRQSRESSASPSLPANGSQPHIIQRPIKICVPSKKELSPGDVQNRSAFFNSTGNDSIAESGEVVEVRVKSELDDVIILEDNQDNGSDTSLNIPHMTYQTAMLDSYRDLASNQIQGSYGSFGEVLGVAGISTSSDVATPPSKRLATTGSIHGSYSGSSEMGPTSDGPFVTGIIQNETLSSDVAPQTTTTTSWEPSQIPDIGSLSTRDSQMILDSIPGCSTCDTSQQSTMRTPKSHSSLPNTSAQSSESKCALRGPPPSTYSDLKGTLFTIGGESKSDASDNMRKLSKREKLLKCATCGARFHGKCALTIHIRTHTGERPFKCDTCGSCFAHNGNLKMHLRTHTGEKPFKCDLCGLHFTQNAHLKTHLRTHTGEQPFKCDLCGLRFTQNGNLKVHVRTHA